MSDNEFNDLDEDFHNLVRGVVCNRSVGGTRCSRGGRGGRGAGGHLGNRNFGTGSTQACSSDMSSRETEIDLAASERESFSNTLNPSNICKSPVKRRKCARNKSHAWDYFKLDNNRLHCQIDHCTQNYSANSSTKSLIYHLRNSHNLELIDNQKPDEDQSDDSIDSHQTNKMPTNKTKYGQDRKKRINDLLIKFIDMDLQAFNIVMSQPFLNFIYELNPKYVVPDSKTIKELINQAFEEKKTQVVEAIKNTNSLLSYTSDCWSSNRCDPYLSLTCHFIDKDFVNRNFLLEFVDFPNPHDQYNISETIYDVIYKLFFSLYINLIFISI